MYIKSVKSVLLFILSSLHFLTICANFHFLIRLLTLLNELKLKLWVCSVGYNILVATATDPASDTKEQKWFLCRSLLWMWIRWSRCLQLIIDISLVVVNCWNFLLYPSYTLLLSLHLYLISPFLIPVTWSIPPPINLHSATPILPESHSGTSLFLMCCHTSHHQYM